MLKLIVNNEKPIRKTCRNSCELFDPITEQCSIKDSVDVDNPLEVRRCKHFLDSEEMEALFNWDDDFDLNSFDDDTSSIIDDDDIFHEFVGKGKFEYEKSTYPLQPDFSARRDDATWYVSPSEVFGCWIINHYKKPMVIPSSIAAAEKGWAKNVYKSPVPLHDHQSSLSLASKMAWYVDEDGFGQYVLLANGNISTISAPKPRFWPKSY